MSDLIERLRKQYAELDPCDPYRADVGEAVEEIEMLRSAADRCYRMLLTDPDTQGALFKAENILREARAAK